MELIGLAKITEIVDPDKFIVRLTMAGVIEEVLAYPLTNDDVPAVDEEVLTFSIDSIIGFSYFYIKLRLIEYTKFEYENNLVTLTNDGITITTADENTITVTSDGDISVTTANNLSIHADGDINIDSGSTLGITADSDISISSGTSLVMESSSDLTIDAGSNLGMSASAQSDMDGASSSISGSSTVDFSGAITTFPARAATATGSGPFNALTTCLFSLYSTVPHGANMLTGG